MYLTRVLADINRESANLNPEHLYKLNEAIFNLPDDDNVDNKCAKKVFQVVEMIRRKYQNGQIWDPENNFYYDYVALLGTLQNQHFFSSAQTDSMLSWIKEAVKEDLEAGAPVNAKAEAATSKAEAKRLADLKEENARLQREMEKLRQVASAVAVLKTFGLSAPAAEKEPKKGEAADAAPAEGEKTKSNRKSKSRRRKGKAAAEAAAN